MNARKLICALAAASALAGCSLIPKPPPAPRIFPLRAAVAPIAAPTPAGAIVIAVPDPVVSTVLAGVDIVWARNGALGYMERGAWPSRTPTALQALLIETIDAQRVALSAVRSGEGARATAELRWQVTDFQVEESRAGLVARFRADVKLMDARTRIVVAAQTFEETEPFDARSAAVAASALAKAAQRASDRIGTWAVGQAAVLPVQPSAASTSR
jgi:ABC-type uncharacterized transport system auxiliary subunit